MSELNWIYSYGFLEARLFDLPNFILCFLFIFVASKRLRVSPAVQFVLILHCFLPFLLNDVLFSTNYMPDQYKYWSAFNLIRNGDFNLAHETQASTVVAASYFFALLPFPNASGPWSLGFYNAFLYVALFFWLHSRQVFTPISKIFYLFFPSFALYSSLSLRDTLIAVFMIVAVQLARENKKILMFFAVLPLYFIKFQNLIIIFPLVLIYSFFKVSQKGMSIIKAAVISLISMLMVFVSAPITIPIVNKYRLAMFVEDGGQIEDISLISGVGDFILQGLTSGLYFLSKPFIWEASGALQLIQSVENFFVLIFLFIITRQAWKNKPDRLIFWLLFMFLSMSVYGLVVANYGTAVRYRYAFVVIYVLFVCSDCNVKRFFLKDQV